MHLNQSQRRYIALLAMPMYLQRPDPDQLFPEFRRVRRPDIRHEVFGSTIPSRDKLLAFFKDLEEQSIYTDFDLLHRKMITLNEEERSALIDSVKKNQPLYRKYCIADYNFKRLPPSGIMAYYLCKCMYFCQMGYAVRMLTKKEAIPLLHGWAMKLQQNYGSWQEYCTAFYAGLLFNNGNNMGYRNLYDKVGGMANWIFTLPQPDWNLKL